MPKFAANITVMFKEQPFLERFEAAANAGFEGVEVLFPYDDAASEILRHLKRADLPLVLMNAPPPNWTGGSRGFAAIPGGEGRFQTDFRRAMRFVDRLGPRFLHIMSGVAEGPEARAALVTNLKWAAETAPDQQLLIEPLNPKDMPGYYLNDFDLAADILAEVSAPNVHLQFDAYHAQMITGDVFATWDRHGHLARHIQVASAPDRAEPDKGVIDYPRFFEVLDAAGYDGFVSGEYTPVARTEEGLDWIKRKRR